MATGEDKGEGKADETGGVKKLGGTPVELIVEQLAQPNPLLTVITTALKELPAADIHAYDPITHALTERRERLGKIHKSLLEKDKKDPAMQALAKHMAQVFANDDAEEKKKREPLGVIKTELASEKPSRPIVSDAVYDLVKQVGSHTAYEQLSGVLRPYEEKPDSEKTPEVKAAVAYLRDRLTHMHKKEEWSEEHRRENANRQWGFQ